MKKRKEYSSAGSANKAQNGGVFIRWHEQHSNYAAFKVARTNLRWEDYASGMKEGLCQSNIMKVSPLNTCASNDHLT